MITRGQANARARAIQRACAQGRCFRVHAGIYLREFDSSRQALQIRANWIAVASALAPGSVVSYRSAMNLGDEPPESLVLSHPTRFNRSLHLPGLSIRLVRGAPALPGDVALGSGALHLASTPRALLENLSRRRGTQARSEGEGAVGLRLRQIERQQGAGQLRVIRSLAADLAGPLQLPREFERLCALIDDLIGPAPQQIGPAPVRAAADVPDSGADLACLERLQELAERLRGNGARGLAAPAVSEAARIHFAFVEAFLTSNAGAYGVSIEQAREAFFAGASQETDRPEVAQLRGAFKLALHRPFCDSVPPFGVGFTPALQARHGLLLQGRPRVEAGRLRARTMHPSRGVADPARIASTLAAGSQLANRIPEGLARAVFYALMLAQVKPFEHGGEILARLLMNAELSGASRARVLIPTCVQQQLREAREAMMRQSGGLAYFELIEPLQGWSAGLDCSDLDRLIDTLRQSGALERGGSLPQSGSAAAVT